MAKPPSSVRSKWRGLVLPVAAVVVVLSFAGIVLAPDRRAPERAETTSVSVAPPLQSSADHESSLEGTAPETQAVPSAHETDTMPPRQALASRSGHLELTLEHADQRPVQEALVRATSEQRTREAISDLAGHALIAVPPGTFELEIIKRDELVLHHFTGQVQAGQTLEAKLVLQPGTGARGRVVDERGSPLAAVHITDAKRLPSGQAVDLGVTREDGSFELVLAPGDGFSLNLWVLQGQPFRDALGRSPRSWRLMFARQDRASRTVPLEAAPGTWVELGDLALEAGCQLVVVVTDTQGGAISGARVALAREPGVAGNLPWSVQSADTDANGHAELAGLPAGLTAAVLVTHAEYMPHRSTAPSTLQAGRPLSLDVVLERGASISGRVEAEEHLRAGLHVRLFASGPRDAFTRALKVTDCDDDGAFHFAGLASGSYDLEARSTTQRVAVLTELALAASEHKDAVTLIATEAFAIPVVVMTGRDVPAGMRVTLEAWEPTGGAREPVARRLLVLNGKGPRFGPYYLDTPHAGPFTLKLTPAAASGERHATTEMPGAVAGQTVEMALAEGEAR